MSQYEPPKDRGKVFTWFTYEMNKWYRTFAWLPVRLESDNSQDRFVWLKPVCVKYVWKQYWDSESVQSEYRPYDSNVREWRWGSTFVKGTVRTILFIVVCLTIALHCNAGGPS